jgi:hypothetical protein
LTVRCLPDANALGSPIHSRAKPGRRRVGLHVKGALHETSLGAYYLGDSAELLQSDLREHLRGQVQLILTSPLVGALRSVVALRSGVDEVLVSCADVYQVLVW